MTMTFRDIYYMLLGILMAVASAIAVVSIENPGLSALCSGAIFCIAWAYGEWVARTVERETKP